MTTGDGGTDDGGAYTPDSGVRRRSRRRRRRGRLTAVVLVLMLVPVAVLGIGGLGHLAVQYAKAAGFETIAVSHSPDKDKMIRDLGADEVVRDGKGLAAAGGADVILSTSNSTKSMVDSIQGLRPDGRLVTMGADAEPLSVSLMDLISKRIRIIGSQQNGPEYLYEALDFVAKGKVKTIVETYPLAEAPKAYDRVAEGKARFRAVLTM